MWSTICSVLARCRIFLWPVLQHGGHSHLPFFAKIFIRRPLGSTLSRQGLGSGTCFFCAILFKDNTHVYYMLYSSYNLEVLIKDLASVISLLFDASTMGFWSMFKMVQIFNRRHGVKAYLTIWNAFLCGSFGCWNMWGSYSSFLMALLDVHLAM